LDHCPNYPGIIEAQGKLVARLPMLTNRENGSADLMQVAEANGRFVESLDGQILAYAAGYEQRRVLWKVIPPGKIVTDCITVNSLVRATMNAQIRLLVALKPARRDAHWTINRSFYKSAQYTAWAKWARTPHMDRGYQCR
jgi:hypothetical protein